jgi:LacI family transcriptional regulator
VGVDDPHWAEFVNPCIPAIAQAVGAMAREAFGMLIARIDGDIGPPRRWLHASGLIVRASAGPIR